MSTPEILQHSDEAQIRSLIAEVHRALCAKDMDRVMSWYAADAILFDAKPPHQTRGKAAWRATWEECLPYFPDSFGIETRDLRVVVGGELAFAHWLLRFTGMETAHGADQPWVRITGGYRKSSGRWEIVHEHSSVPFDPYTSQAVLSRDPAVRDGV